MDQHSFIKEIEVISRTMVVVYSVTRTLVPTVLYTMHTPLVTLDTWMENVTERQSMAAIYILPVRTTTNW